MTSEPRRYMTISTNVEAMRLDDKEAFRNAWYWLSQNRIHVELTSTFIPERTNYSLEVEPPGGGVTILKGGEWVVIERDQNGNLSGVGFYNDEQFSAHFVELPDGS
jgi:hypothetical protein